MERAWARARRPGPKFWLTINKPQARGSRSQISKRLEVGLNSNFSILISKKLGLEVGSSAILTGSGLFGLEKFGLLQPLVPACAGGAFLPWLSASVYHYSVQAQLSLNAQLGCLMLL